MSKKILIIDDDNDILHLMSYLLNEEGYSVKSSTTGKILSKLEKIKPDLILLDCWLGGVFGDDLCREIKCNPLFKHIPIIMVSAIKNLDFISKQCKAEAYIEKPFDINHLSDMVKQYCPQETSGSKK